MNIRIISFTDRGRGVSQTLAAAKASENGSCLLAKTAKDGMTVSIYAKEWRAEF